MKLRITQGPYTQEVTLLESPPSISPYLVITYNEMKYYARLSTSGTGICINGLFPFTEPTSSYVAIPILDTADVVMTAPVTIEALDNLVTPVGMFANIEILDQGDARRVGIPKADVQDTIQVVFPPAYATMSGDATASIGCTAPLYIEAIDNAIVTPVVNTVLDITEDVTAELTLIG